MANIYISSVNGNDIIGNGSINQPYATFNKVKSIAGLSDKIYLEAGSVFEEFFAMFNVDWPLFGGTPTNRSAITSYGDIETLGKPKFTGRALVSSFSLVGNEYEASYTPSANDPNMLIVDGQRLKRGTAGALLSAEWDYNATTDILYIKDDPSASTVYVSNLAGCWTYSRKYIDWSNIEFELYTGGINVNPAINGDDLYLTFENMLFFASGNNGFNIAGGSSITLKNCSFNESSNNGFNTTGITNNIKVIDCVAINDAQLVGNDSFTLHGTGTNSEFRNCYGRGAGENVFDVTPGNLNCKLINCFGEESAAEIFVVNGAGAKIINSIAYMCPRGGFSIAGDDILVENSLVIDCGSSNFITKWGVGSIANGGIAMINSDNVILKNIITVRTPEAIQRGFYILSGAQNGSIDYCTTLSDAGIVGNIIQIVSNADEDTWSIDNNRYYTYEGSPGTQFQINSGDANATKTWLEWIAETTQDQNSSYASPQVAPGIFTGDEYPPAPSDELILSMVGFVPQNRPNQLTGIDWNNPIEPYNVLNSENVVLEKWWGTGPRDVNSDGDGLPDYGIYVGTLADATYSPV